jgi:hypothetical protein
MGAKMPIFTVVTKPYRRHLHDPFFWIYLMRRSSMNWKRLWLIASVFVTTIGFATGLAAQSLITGDITGTVTDAQGAVVPDAKVTLNNPDKGITKETKTNSSGVYRFSLLPPGTYLITVALSGFRSETRTTSVNVGQVSTIDVSLAVGAATETITVTEEAPLVKVDNGDVDTTIGEQQVSQVPNPGNDVTYPAQLTPGVVGNTAGGGLGNFAANGISASSNLFVLNGMDNNDPYLNLNNSGATNLTLGQNEVQEISVVTNGYSGQYGGLAGANITYSTRSGTNQFHGRAIYYWNGSALNANSFFNNKNGAPKSFVDANQWGGDFGGPILKNKLFGYFNTEGLRLALPVSTTALIPSPQFEAATLANLGPSGGDPHPASVPFYQKIFNLYNTAPGASRAVPVSTAGLGCGTFTQAGFGTSIPCALSFQSTAGAHTHDALYTGRVDYNLSSSDRMFLRINREHGLQASITDPINPLFKVTSDQPQWQGQFNESHTFGSAAVNQFVLAGQWYSAIFGNPKQSATLAAFPTTLQMGDGTLSNLGGFDSTFPQGRNVTEYQITDDYSRDIRNHTLKVGAKFRRYDVSDFVYGQNSIGTLNVATLGALFDGGFVPGDPTQVTQLVQNFPSALVQPMAFYSVGGYIQDDWRIKSNLLLSFALRLDHPSNPVCQRNCFAQTMVPFAELNHSVGIPYNQALRSGVHEALPGLTNLEWQPRFSLAWQPFGRNRNTVVRGGVGIFYDAFQGQVVDFMSANAPRLNAFSVAGDNLAPTEASNLFRDAANSNAAFLAGFNNGLTFNQIAASVPGFAPPGITSTDRRNLVPQYQKWNLEIQQGIGRNSSVSINYVGNHGIHELNGSSAANAFCPPATCPNGFVGLPAAAVDSRFGFVTILESRGVSNYNGLQISGQHRFTSGLIQVNYTWSHALDMISNAGINGFSLALFGANFTSLEALEDPNNPRRNYGNADYDVRHYVTMNYVWELPINRLTFGHGPSALVKGWQVSGTLFARTGLPYSVFDLASSSVLAGNNYGTGPNTIFGEELFANFKGGSVGSCNTSTLTCLNPAQFTRINLAAAGAGFGNTGRGAFRGPSYFNTDFTLMKKTKIPGWERGEFGIGAQMYNVFNHPNFDLPISNVADGRFGQLTRAVSPATTLFGSGLGADASPRLVQLKAEFTF